MNTFLKVLNDLSEIEVPEINKIDLTKQEDRDLVRETINDLRNNELFSSLLSLFCDDNIFDRLDNELNKIEEKENKKVKRPSELISTEAGLQIHKLVQEYVDTMIKPYNPTEGGLTQKAINDAYAGLYEFSCWLYNK